MTTDNPLHQVDVTILARMTHAAESDDDDITFLAIQSEIEGRPFSERERYRIEYIRISAEIYARRRSRKGLP